MNTRFAVALLTCFMMMPARGLYAQHQELHEKPSIWSSKNAKEHQDNSILNAFKNGTFHGHFRYFFMATDNEKNLTDYYANAAGGGLRFETSPYHGFQFAVSGFYIFNIASSDLTMADSASGQLNRYELGLFDIEDPANKKDLDRLEELYLKYNFGKSKISIGKQLINTPFVNLQDGRMRPTGVEGIYTEVNELKNTKIEGGVLYAISPRSTTKWYYIEESIGVYSSGINEAGQKSNYAGNLESKFVALGAVHHQFGKHVKLQVWDTYVDRIFNTSFQQVDVSMPVNETGNIVAGVQAIQQFAVADGGNADPAKAYIRKGSKAYTFGAKLGYTDKKSEYSIQYNRITSHGRYLMPREWGREPFFTFMSRERNEGLGDVHAFVGKVSRRFTTINLKSTLAAGYFKTPDVKNVALNKYGLPSYYQINGDVRYQFGGLLHGLEAQALLVAKIRDGQAYSNARYIINKNNMLLYNVVLNYHF